MTKSNLEKKDLFWPIVPEGEAIIAEKDGIGKGR